MKRLYWKNGSSVCGGDAVPDHIATAWDSLIKKLCPTVGHWTETCDAPTGYYIVEEGTNIRKHNKSGPCIYDTLQIAQRSIDRVANSPRWAKDVPIAIDEYQRRYEATKVSTEACADTDTIDGSIMAINAALMKMYGEIGYHEWIQQINFDRLLTRIELLIEEEQKNRSD